jgi:hypothetical protein
MSSQRVIQAIRPEDFAIRHSTAEALYRAGAFGKELAGLMETCSVCGVAGYIAQDDIRRFFAV